MASSQCFGVSRFTIYMVVKYKAHISFTYNILLVKYGGGTWDGALLIYIKTIFIVCIDVVCSDVLRESEKIIIN